MLIHDVQGGAAGSETFEMVGTNGKVLNIVSQGQSETDLYMTFTFEWDHPEIEAESKEELDMQKQHQATAPKAVGGTVAVIRKMVTEGGLETKLS